MSGGRSPVARELGGMALLWAITRVGFLVVFAMVSLVFGLWFGAQLLATQREGITAIAHIQELEADQARQLEEMNQRLERIERLLLVQQGQEGR